MNSGLVTHPSPIGFEHTLDRVMSSIARQKLHVLARIDHSAAAESVGLSLAPTQVILFGNPAAGTPVMCDLPTLAIDLPLKVLIWQDRAGASWLSWNDPSWLVERHGGSAESHPTVNAMTKSLEEIWRAVRSVGGAADE